MLILTSWYPSCKSEHYVEVMEVMLFENVVLRELCSEWVTFYSINNSFGSPGFEMLE